MGRPTEEKKDKVIKIRISEDLYERLKGQNMSETIRRALDGKKVGDSVPIKQYKALKERFNTLSARVRPEAQDYWDNEIYTGVEIVPIGFVKQNFVPTELQPILKDTLDMIRLSVGEDEMINFVKDLHDRLESGELQIVNGKLKLGYHEIFEVLNSNEVKGWLKEVWSACDDKGYSYTDGLKAVFKHGSKMAAKDLYGDRQ